LTVSVADVEIDEISPAIELGKAWTLAKDAHGRIGFEHEPLIDGAASVERQPAFEFRAEDFEAVCAARSRERDRLRQVCRNVHKIKTLGAGFEV